MLLHEVSGGRIRSRANLLSQAIHIKCYESYESFNTSEAKGHVQICSIVHIVQTLPITLAINACEYAWESKRSLSSFSHDNFDGGKLQIMENVIHT